MTYRENNIVLSQIVNSTPRSSFFDELIEIPNNTILLSHDLFKINKIVDDIFGYLSQLIGMFRELRNSEMKEMDDIRWFYEGKDGIYDLVKNMENIDSIISQLLGTVDAHAHGLPDFTSLLGKFEETSDLLLEVKKYLIVFKKKVDIAINFVEINDNIIGTLLREIEQCIDIYLNLLELKLSSPKRHLSKFNLEVIISKMKINYLTSTNFSTKSLRLPTFNELDEHLYNEYLSLEARISPLKVSLEYLPLRIEEFNIFCKSISVANLFPHSLSTIEDNHSKLTKRWEHLQNGLKLIKRESLDSKWNEIFTYLIHEIISKCDFLIESLQDKRDEQHLITDEIGSTYKLCSNSITLITKAFAESTIYESPLVSLFNESLVPKWQTLNELLSGPLSSPSTITPNYASLSNLNGNTLKTYHTFKRSPTPENSNKEIFPKKSDHGLGIDLGVDVASSRVPFSIEKKDRVRNFLSPEPKNNNTKRDLKESFTNIEDEADLKLEFFDKGDNESMKEDDEITLVNSKTPKLPYETDHINHKVSRLKIQDTYESVNIWDYLLNTKSNFPSRIPFISEDYISRGLPVIKKKYLTKSKRSRIPTISPNHPIFNDSPERRNEMISLKPPLFLINRSNTILHPSPTPTRSRIQSEDEDVFRKPSRKPSIIRSSNSIVSGQLSRTSSLSETITPNLVYQQSPTYRSTSPDRPSSSIGSRFDDKHLIQPLKSGKPDWK
ncbi:uncharacterized protein AC631_05543 [Debaryomyces fabryi]|uniref:Karyogamy protein n=1 Tax=Debaryomyces fabryi TaxID=58627 RepID=A0A0V1PR42_9ASCO|nr:uncharacterized protein AC631_05543 [Debaryomyces fabryi]KRZ98701.1 hypothetical protein AC631_05543 [Debaryomyces fabryi]CUM56484.1 unnamed protein product [Debaryomyces fabryi]